MSSNGVLPEFDILNFMDRLEVVKELATEYHCTCPACGDGGFKIDKRSGKYAAFKCDCTNAQIREAIRPLSEAFEEHAPSKPVRPKAERKWEYRDRQGKPLVAVKRIDDGNGGRKIMQGHWDGDRYKPGCPAEVRPDIPIYRYSDVQKAISDGEPFVFWVEGEPCADALWGLGIPATTSIGGCEGLERYGNYRDDLQGVQVVLCPDMDLAGLKYAEKVQGLYPDALWCYAFPDSAWWDKVPQKGGLDIADWVDQGATRDQILEAIGDKRKPVALTDDDKKAGEIEALVRAYLGEPNAAKRALLKTRLLRDYGLPRPELKDLEQAYAPLPEIKLRHISGPSTDYEISLLDVIEKKATGEIEAGIPTGFTDLDRRLRGVRRKKLYLIAGRPSDGKSALAENIALNVAKATQRAGKTDPVVIFSPEMTHDEWKERALAIESGIDSGRIAAGMIADHEWGPLAQHYATVDSLPVFIDDSTGITVEYMQRSCEWMQENHGLPSMVIVDYLSLVSADGTSSNNRVQEISHIARQLQKMAKALNVPLFVLSQLSRALMGRNDKRPVLSDLRESGELEQVADVVMMLYRDEEHNPDTLDKGITEVILRKNRQGSKGTVKLLFEAEFTRFRDIA